MGSQGVLRAGKTHLLNAIVMHLRETFGADFSGSVAVTAATGIAATHIGGARSFVFGNKKKHTLFFSCFISPISFS